MAAPLFVLMFFSVFGGWITIPVESVFSHGEEHAEHHVSSLMHGIMIAVPLLGVGVSYLFYVTKTFSIENLMASALAKQLHKFWFSGWGMDWVYDTLFVNPFMLLARINRADLVDKGYGLIVEITRAAHGFVARSQTGSLQWYAITVAAGLLLLVYMGVLL